MFKIWLIDWHKIYRVAGEEITKNHFLRKIQVSIFHYKVKFFHRVGTWIIAHPQYISAKVYLHCLNVKIICFLFYRFRHIYYYMHRIQLSTLNTCLNFFIFSFNTNQKYFELTCCNCCCCCCIWIWGICCWVTCWTCCVGGAYWGGGGCLTILLST